MSTTNLTIILGTREYTVNVGNPEFLAYLNSDLDKLKDEKGVIEIPVFINEFLKKSYNSYSLQKQLDNLNNENAGLKERLSKQEKELLSLLDNFKKIN